MFHMKHYNLALEIVSCETIACPLEICTTQGKSLHCVLLFLAMQFAYCKLHYAVAEGSILWSGAIVTSGIAVTSPPSSGESVMFGVGIKSLISGIMVVAGSSVGL